MTGRSEGHHRGTARSSTEQHIKVNSGSTRFNRFMLTRGFFRFYENYVQLCSTMFSVRNFQKQIETAVLPKLCPAIETQCDDMPLLPDVFATPIVECLPPRQRVRKLKSACKNCWLCRAFASPLESSAGWCWMVLHGEQTREQQRTPPQAHKHP